MPSIYSWYVGVQRELPAKFSLDVSYSGNHAIHLMDQRRVNAVPANTFVLTRTCAVRQFQGRRSPAILRLGQPERRRDPRLFPLQRDDVPPQPPLQQSLAVNFNYTRSSAMDLLDNDSDNITNPFNMRQNWAKAGYDQTNVFTTDFVYDFPKVKGALNNPVGTDRLERLGSHRHVPRSIGHADLHQLQRIDHGRGLGKPVRRISSAIPMPDRTSMGGSIPPLSSVRPTASTATSREMRSACPVSATWTPASSRTSPSRKA